MPKVVDSPLEVTARRVASGECRYVGVGSDAEYAAAMLTTALMICDRVGVTKTFLGHMAEMVYAAYQLGRCHGTTNVEGGR